MSTIAGLSTYAQAALLNYFRGTPFPAVPANLYMALFTTAPGNGAAGTEVTAAAAPTYARLAIVPATSFGAPSASAGVSTIANAVNLTLAAMGNSTSISVVGWGLYDAATGGNLWVYGPLTSTALAATDTAQFTIGNLTVSAQ
jgi:hypothetical protein